MTSAFTNKYKNLKYSLNKIDTQRILYLIFHIYLQIKQFFYTCQTEKYTESIITKYYN